MVAKVNLNNSFNTEISRPLRNDLQGDFSFFSSPFEANYFSCEVDSLRKEN